MKTFIIATICSFAVAILLNEMHAPDYAIGLAQASIISGSMWFSNLLKNLALIDENAQLKQRIVTMQMSREFNQKNYSKAIIKLQDSIRVLTQPKQ